jgi:DNA repair ATPase RecN
VNLDNLLIEKNNQLETIKKLQRSYDNSQGKIDKYLNEMENLYEEIRFKDNTCSQLTEENVNVKRNNEALKKDNDQKL